MTLRALRCDFTEMLRCAAQELKEHLERMVLADLFLDNPKYAYPDAPPPPPLPLPSPRNPLLSSVEWSRRTHVGVVCPRGSRYRRALAGRSGG